LKQDLGLS